MNRTLRRQWVGCGRDGGRWARGERGGGSLHLSLSRDDAREQLLDIPGRIGAGLGYSGSGKLTAMTFAATQKIKGSCLRGTLRSRRMDAGSGGDPDSCHARNPRPPDNGGRRVVSRFGNDSGAGSAFTDISNRDSSGPTGEDDWATRLAAAHGQGDTSQ